MRKNQIIKFILVFCLLFTFSVVVPATTQSKIKWERFAFQDPDFSVLLPKLPIVIDETNYDYSEETKKFGAYSNGVAYVVSISREAKINPFKEFRKVEPFTAQNFQTRYQKIRAEFETRKEEINETKISHNGWEVIQLKSVETIYKLYFNLVNNSWIELWAINPDDSKTAAAKFLDSLKIEKNPQGRKVNEGAIGVAKVSYLPKAQNTNSSTDLPLKANTITNPEKSLGISSGIGNGTGIGSKQNISGDNNNKASNKLKAAKKKEAVNIEKMRLVLKPKANYTEEARRNLVSGTVRVRVTFAATGSVTAISVAESLSHGLTEQAIVAASKMLFVPEKHNGIPVSLIRTVEYNFNLY